jgi:hypothetical protein
MRSWYTAMIDPNPSDDAIRKLIAEATDILDARRNSDLASLIRGVMEDQLRHLIRQACEELERRRGLGAEREAVQLPFSIGYISRSARWIESA